MKQTVLESLNKGLLDALKADPGVILIGEDILDPYGGAFKVTRGCSTHYPDRVMAAPISEAGLAGFSAGMALRGLRPVLEIMFGDFTTLLADQLVNHISKFRWMYNNTIEMPLVIRTPMGGRRGYGPTHSQTLEKLFLGVPGLKVVAPVNLVLGENNLSPGELLRDQILTTHDPVLFIENKLQYLLPLYYENDLTDLEVSVLESGEQPDKFQVIRLVVAGAPPPRVSITAYGYMADLVRQAMLKLAYEEEIFTELVIPTLLSPFHVDTLVASVGKTGRLVVIEEGTRTLGWGAEIVARVVEQLPGEGVEVKRVTAMDLPIPAAPSLERCVLPQVEDIQSAVREVARKHV